MKLTLVVLVTLSLVILSPVCINVSAQENDTDASEPTIGEAVTEYAVFIIVAISSTLLAVIAFYFRRRNRR